MNYPLIIELISQVKEFEENNHNSSYKPDIEGFEEWLYDHKIRNKILQAEPSWEGKENGRSPESVINTLIVHLNNYAQTYSKSAIHDSEFSPQSEFIYLINLKAFGSMSKIELIKKNIQGKSAGIQIINRLIKKNWIEQTDSEIDKRSKLIRIPSEGLHELENQMDKIRQATNIVTGDLTHSEKMELIRLLDKLDKFHQPIYNQNLSPENLLDYVNNQLDITKT